MGFQEAVRTCLGKYAVFQGRARRAEFWWFALFNILTSLVLGVVDGAVFGFGESDIGIFGALFSLAVFLPGLGVSVRRLHDVDKSGWWLLIMFVPLIGFLLLIYWDVQTGTDGPNRFGPDPLDGNDNTGVHDDDIRYSQSNIPRVPRKS